MIESVKKALATIKGEPYFHVEMKSGEPGKGTEVKYDYNRFFILELDKIGYANYESDDDKVDAYVMSCYYETARSEGGGLLSELRAPELDEEM